MAQVWAESCERKSQSKVGPSLTIFYYFSLTKLQLFVWHMLIEAFFLDIWDFILIFKIHENVHCILLLVLNCKFMAPCGTPWERLHHGTVAWCWSIHSCASRHKPIVGLAIYRCLWHGYIWSLLTFWSWYVSTCANWHDKPLYSDLCTWGIY